MISVLVMMMKMAIDTVVKMFECFCCVSLDIFCFLVSAKERFFRCSFYSKMALIIFFNQLARFPFEGGFYLRKYGIGIYYTVYFRCKNS